MTPFERQNAIVEILGQERQTTIAKLAATFNVTERTIRNDITALSSNHPVLTVRGRFGGVQLADWYHPSANKLSPKQEELLQRLKPTLAGNDLIVLTVSSHIFPYRMDAGRHPRTSKIEYPILNTFPAGHSAEGGCAKATCGQCPCPSKTAQ